MPNIKFDNILGGMNWDVPAHAIKANEWTQMQNCRTWERNIQTIGGYVPEFATPLGIANPNMLQYWQAINSGGTEQGYFVYALAGNIRRISPAGDSDIRGLNPTFQPTANVATIVSATQLTGTNLGTFAPTGTFVSPIAGNTPVQVTSVVNASTINVTSTASWAPIAALQANVVTSVNSATTLIGTGIGTGLVVGNQISADGLGTSLVAVLSIIDANTITVTSTAQWGTALALSKNTIYLYTQPTYNSFYTWAVANYTNVLSGGASLATDEWNFTALSGGYNMVVSNPSIVPQYMSGDDSQLKTLPGFIYGSINGSQVIATTCQVIRAFRNKLICAGLSHRLANGTIVQRPSTIRISNNTAPGGVPQVWQPAATNAADEFELTSTDPIQDIVILQNYAYVVCKNSTWLVGDSTSQTATPVTQISSTRGCIGKGAITVVDGLAYMVTTDDIVVNDGTQTNWKSIANDVVKSTFFENRLSRTLQQGVFIRYERYYDELLIAYPNQSSLGSCNEALIYDLDSKAWHWTELPGINDMTNGPVVGNNDALRPWPVNTYNQNYYRLHFAVTNQLEAWDVGYSRGGAYSLIAEKFFDFSDIQGLDQGLVKNIYHFFPKIVSDTPATVTLKLNFYNAPTNIPFNWASPDYAFNFDVGQTAAGTYSDFHVPVDRIGRFMAMQILITGTTRIQIIGFELHVLPSKLEAFG